jgi:hypothetical protein
MFLNLRELCAGEDVIAGIALFWARLVAKGSTVDELLVGDPRRLVSVTSRYQSGLVKGDWNWSLDAV